VESCPLFEEIKSLLLGFAAFPQSLTFFYLKMFYNVLQFIYAMTQKSTCKVGFKDLGLFGNVVKINFFDC
jgi:hypothetical protein